MSNVVEMTRDEIDKEIVDTVERVSDALNGETLITCMSATLTVMSSIIRSAHPSAREELLRGVLAVTDNIIKELDLNNNKKSMH